MRYIIKHNLHKIEIIHIVLVAQLCLTLYDPIDCSLCPWTSPGKDPKSELPFPCPRDLPNPRIEPRCPALWADSSPFEPPRKPYCIIKHNLHKIERVHIQYIFEEHIFFLKSLNVNHNNKHVDKIEWLFMEVDMKTKKDNKNIN